jgi:hypothetical protein
MDQNDSICSVRAVSLSAENAVSSDCTYRTERRNFPDLLLVFYEFGRWRSVDVVEGPAGKGHKNELEASSTEEGFHKYLLLL